MALDKQCKGCYRRLPLEAFVVDKRKSSGRGARCKECHNAYNQENRSADKTFAYWLKSEYGLSVEEYYGMLLAQGGGCAICGKVGRFHVDHDHATGRVRGILCHRCNIALGFFEKTPDIIRLFVKYLEQHTREAIQGADHSHVLSGRKNI